MAELGLEAKKWTAKEIIERLARHHPADQWAFFPELATTTAGNKNRIDAWAMAYVDYHRFKRVAYEVKVSRSDFLAEIKKPRKRANALMLSNEFYFAAPKGLINLAELPPECGLIEVDENDRLYTTAQAPWRESYPPTYEFMATFFRRLPESVIRKEYEQKDEWAHNAVKELAEALLAILYPEKQDGLAYHHGDKYRCIDPDLAAERALNNYKVQAFLNRLGIKL